MKKNELSTLIKNFLENQNLALNTPIVIETPKDKSHGDYATPVCFSLAKELRKSPKVIAEDFCKILNDVSTILNEASTVSNLDELILILLVFDVISFACDIVIPVFAVLVATSDLIEFNDKSIMPNL